MKFFVFMLVAMATIVSCENMQMIELTPAVSSNSNCDVSLWCQDRATAERCDKVSYCTKWIWEEVPVQEVSASPCDICKEIIKEVLEYNDTEIEVICKVFFPGDQNCSAKLHKYIQGETPEKVCQQVGLCPQSADLSVTVVMKLFMSEAPKQPELLTDECDICKEIIDLILNNTDTFKKILEGFCAKVKTIKFACDLLVDEIISILNKENSTSLCQDIKLCSLPPPQLLGADMCTRGPAYWCASHDNAKECNALEFCEEKYWM